MCPGRAADEEREVKKRNLSFPSLTLTLLDIDVNTQIHKQRPAASDEKDAIHHCGSVLGSGHEAVSAHS